jgi:hypothetical protein
LGRFSFDDERAILPSWTMPIRYELDDLQRRIVVTVEGLFFTDDILAIMARQRAEQTWTYGILYDLRGMTGEPTIAELRELMNEAARRHLGQAPRGPVALLATDAALYARLCTLNAASIARTRGAVRDPDRIPTRCAVAPARIYDQDSQSGCAAVVLEVGVSANL